MAETAVLLCWHCTSNAHMHTRPPPQGTASAVMGTPVRLRGNSRATEPGGGGSGGCDPKGKAQDGLGGNGRGGHQCCC